MKYVIFAAFIMIAMVMAAEEEEVCTPWKETGCQVNSDCCRGLRCKTDTNECVAIGGVALPEMDKRPLGPGPYPPNVKLD